MRLLQLHENNSLSFGEFVGDEIPEYAILSHTWGPDAEEVNFRDLVEGTGKRKSGYDKICLCGKQAQKDGLLYFWVDTCCIDKSSSSELSEAINSMFQWYRNSTKCYAYLADVPRPEKQHGATSSTGFAASRWFTRGWTLQELLAPAHVHFFSKDWEELGTKVALLDTISRVTGIDAAFLSGSSALSQASIAKRMSWASRRVTTRLEDRAYSLFGIFGVNMPLIYGEAENAFIRLQEEIMRTSDDQSLFAWGEPRESSAYALPAYTNSLTTGPVLGLFACSPSQFATCGDIVPDEVTEIREPHVLTNKGVRLALPLYRSEFHCNQIAILACRPETSLLHVCAMPLNELGRDQYGRARNKPMIISRDEVIVVTNQTIYIRQSLEASAVTSIHTTLLPPGFWIRSLPSVLGLSIKRVCPTECWDAQNRVVHSPQSATEWDDWEVSVEIAARDQDDRILSIGYLNGYPFARLLEHQNRYRTEIQHANSLSTFVPKMSLETKILAMGCKVRMIDFHPAPKQEHDRTRAVFRNRVFT